MSFAKKSTYKDLARKLRARRQARRKLRNAEVRLRSGGRNAQLEWLEPRTMLSVSAGVEVGDLGLFEPHDEFDAPSHEMLLADGAVAMTWNGRDVYASPGEWIARFSGISGSPDEQKEAIQRLIDETEVADHGLPPVGDYGVKVADHLGLDGLVVLTADVEVEFQDAYQSLLLIPSLEYVEPNFVDLQQASTFPNDPYFGLLYGMHNTGRFISGYGRGTADADIDAVEAWDITTGSRDVVVAVIDTGVDYNHPDLAANIWRNTGEVAGNGIDDDGNGFVDDVHGYDFVNNDGDPRDDDWHGTHVAGTLAAVGNNGFGLTGVAWNVQIMPLKILNYYGYGTTVNAIHALNYATMMSRDFGVNVVLTNNSWTGEYSAALRDAIAASAEEDMLFVAAAGNGGADRIGDNNDIIPQYPASYDLDNIIAVAATDNRDDRPSFSNYGPSSVDLGAPGAAIFSTLPNRRYGSFSGTSMAVPHVSGVAALAASLPGGFSYRDIRDAIFAGVDPLPSLAGKTATGGRLNAWRTLQELENTLKVTTSSPAEGEILTSTPVEFTIEFSGDYDPASVDAHDLTVNGIQADAVTLTESDALTFSYQVSPVTWQGLQKMEIAEGSITKAGSGRGVRAYVATFRYDAVRMAAIATEPVLGATTILPMTTLQMHLNEPFDSASVDADDLMLSQGTATAVTVVDEDTVEYTLSGITEEGVLTLVVSAGAMTDIYGNPMTAFSSSTNLDVVKWPYPALRAVAPLGSLIYDPARFGIIGNPSDTDAFTIDIDAGQRVTVILTTAGTLQGTVALVDGDGVVRASGAAAAPGEPVVLQAIETRGQLDGHGPGPQTYEIVVGGTNGTVGDYSVEVVLNAAVELENYGQSKNDHFVAAQDLEPSFVPLHSAVDDDPVDAHPERGAVVGRLAGGGTATSPAQLEAIEGNSANRFPFHLVRNPRTMRYQQIYSSSDFASGGLIDEVRFRRNSGQRGFEASGIDVQVSLGYAATTAAAASRTFAENIGEEYVTVFDGLLDLSSSGVGKPNPFDIVIDVDDVFQYDPARGSLLLDIRMRNTPRTAFFDATNRFQQSSTTSILAADVGASTGVLAFGGAYGLVTQFAFVPDSDWYSFDLNSGESATLGLTNLTGGIVQMSVVDESGSAVAHGMATATNLDQVLNTLVAPVPAKYYVQVSGDPGAKYSLLVTRNAEFDTERNSDLASAQPLVSPLVAGRRWAMGAITEQSSQLYATGNRGSELIQIDPTTGLARTVGALGYQQAYAGAFTPDGTFWTIVNSTSSTAQLATVNLASGVATPVGSPNWTGSPVISLESNDAGTLYGARYDGTLMQVDRATGQMSVIGAPGSLGVRGTRDLVFDRTGGLWALDRRNGLWRIDPESGIGSFQSDISGLNGWAMGLMVDPTDGSFYLTTWAARSNLYRLDPTTGTAVVVGSGLGQPYPTGGDFSPQGSRSDWFQITVDGNSMLKLETQRPAHGAGEFTNRLDPMVRVYDANGSLVASDDNSASDRVNARLSYKVPKNAGGTYYVEVLASDATGGVTAGEYILSVRQATGALPSFNVSAASPIDGLRARDVPTQMTLNFNDAILLTTADGSDLTVSGAAGGDVTPVNGGTLLFDLPPAAFQWESSAGGNDHYYVRTSAATNVFEAQAEAAALGGHLVSIGSEAEQNFLTQRFLTGNLAREIYWIGLDDALNEGSYAWASGEPVTYENWLTSRGEPTPSETQDFVALNWHFGKQWVGSQRGTWSNHIGQEKFFGIIELDTLPVDAWLVTDGVHEFSLAAGAIQDIQGTPVTPFTSTIELDLTPPRVVRVSPREGEVAPSGNLVLEVEFSEPMNVANLDSSDFELYGTFRKQFYGDTSSSFNADGTVLTIHYTNLPDDRYTFTLLTGHRRFQDLLGWHLDGEPTGGVSGNGLEGGVFWVDLALDGPTVAYPTPLESKSPLGSLIYDPSSDGTVAFAGDVDSYTIDLDAGQTLTVLANADGNLQPAVEVSGPSGGTLGNASATAIGESVALQVPAASAGTYTISISGVGGTMGLFEVQSVLNAALEREWYTSEPNNARESAQNIEGSFIPLLKGADRGAVLGQLDSSGISDEVLGPDGFGYLAQSVPFVFEDISTSGTRVLTGSDDDFAYVDLSSRGFRFPFYGETYSTVFFSSNGLITFGTGNAEPGNGTLVSWPSEATIAPFWDDLVISTLSSRDGVFYDLRGSGDDQRLVVQWNDVRFFGGRYWNPMSFQAVLWVDGNIQFNYRDLRNSDWSRDDGRSATVGIKDAGSQGLNRLLISYNEGPNEFVRTGRSTRIFVHDPPSDYYSFELDAGETVTVAATGLTAAGVGIKLENMDGVVVAAGAQVGTNVDEVISNYVAPESGTYFVRVTGSEDVQYSLVVTRDAVFDTEENDSLATAQTFAGLQVALGHAGEVATDNATIHVAVLNTHPYTTFYSDVITNQLNDDTYFDFEATTVNSSRLNSLAELMNYDVVVLGSHHTSPFPSAVATAIRQWIEGGHGGVVGTAFLYHQLLHYSSAFVRAELDAVLPIDMSPSSYRSTYFGTTQVVDSSHAVTSGIASLPGVWYGESSYAGADVGASVLALDSNTYPAITVSEASGGRAVQLAPGYSYYSSLRVPGSPGDRLLEQAVAWAGEPQQGGPNDVYSFTANEGEQIDLFTVTPGEGPGEFANSLDPRLTLYDPSGNPVATGVPFSDARNEQILYTVPTGAAGLYRVEVSAENGTSGEYILDPVSTPVGTTPSLATVFDRVDLPVGAGDVGLAAWWSSLAISAEVVSKQPASGSAVPTDPDSIVGAAREIVDAPANLVRPDLFTSLTFGRWSGKAVGSTWSVDEGHMLSEPAIEAGEFYFDERLRLRDLDAVDQFFARLDRSGSV